MTPSTRLLGVLFLPALLLSACSREFRSLDPEQPQTPPNGPNDPRWSQFTSNAWQVSQGGRYFSWYGCGQCHGVEAKGVLNLADGQWKHGGRPDQVYAMIAHGHPGALARYGDRIPTEQIWQITGYIMDLQTIPAEKRRRQDLDEAAEPTGNSWTGPVQ